MAPGAPLIPVTTGSSLASRAAGPFQVTLMEHFGDVRLEPHRHREAIITLLLRGRYDERLDGRTVEPARASLLIKPPETPHANRIGCEGTDTILLQVLPNVIPDEFRSVLSRSGIRLDARFFAIGREMLAELRYGAPTETLGLEALASELLSLAAEPHRRAGAGYSKHQLWVTRVRERLHDTVDGPSLSELATFADVDRAHLARTFRRVFGCTIGEYTRALRMERAARWLARNDVSIAHVAAELGFCDQAHFTRAFRATYGAAPGVWRRRQ
jgi:AraC family transcriptional regulator